MKIAVFCGSLPGKREAYLADARRLGEWIASEGHELIYGAGKEGMMGEVADAALSGGASVTGIIPKFMKDNGWCHEHLTNLIVTEDLADRKEKMAEMADAFIALPGGLGTLEEIADILSWMRIDFFEKPFILFNTEEFYKDLYQVIQSLATEEFMDQKDADRVVLSDDPESISAYLQKVLK